MPDARPHDDPGPEHDGHDLERPGHDHGDDHGHDAPASPTSGHGRGDRDHPATFGHHDHHHGKVAERSLLAALFLTLGFMGVEVAAGILTNSLALLADAGHMLADASALGLAVVAQRIATRPRTTRRTFGHRRAETLAAFVNGIALGGTALWGGVEAIRRWSDPPEVLGVPMLVVAAVGLLVNLVAAYLLAGGGNENTRAALYHVVSDALGSVGAMLAAGAILAFDWKRADPAISLVLTVLMLWGAVRLVARAADVLMEGAPPGLDLVALERAIHEVPGVASTHDLHAWCIAHDFGAVSVHVVLERNHHGTEVASAVCARVRERFGIAHVTVQPEEPEPALVPLSRGPRA